MVNLEMVGMADFAADKSSCCHCAVGWAVV